MGEQRGTRGVCSCCCEDRLRRWEEGRGRDGRRRRREHEHDLIKRLWSFSSAGTARPNMRKDSREHDGCQAHRPGLRWRSRPPIESLPRATTRQLCRTRGNTSLPALTRGVAQRLSLAVTTELCLPKVRQDVEMWRARGQHGSLASRNNSLVRHPTPPFRSPFEKTVRNPEYLRRYLGWKMEGGGRYLGRHARSHLSIHPWSGCLGRLRSARSGRKRQAGSRKCRPLLA